MNDYRDYQNEMAIVNAQVVTNIMKDELVGANRNIESLRQQLLTQSFKN
jgi:hypothetical protein